MIHRTYTKETTLTQCLTLNCIYFSLKMFQSLESLTLVRLKLSLVVVVGHPRPPNTCAWDTATMEATTTSNIMVTGWEKCRFNPACITEPFYLKNFYEVLIGRRINSFLHILWTIQNIVYINKLTSDFVSTTALLQFPMILFCIKREKTLLLEPLSIHVAEGMVFLWLCNFVYEIVL